MLEDELLLVAGFEDHRVLVERSDTTRQLHAADQIDRNIVPLLACRVEEGILNVLLRRLGFHCRSPFLRFDAAPRACREGQSAAALFLSAPTIRPCPALFNFPLKVFCDAALAHGTPTAHSRPPPSIDRGSFPAPAIYNRHFQTRVSE